VAALSRWSTERLCTYGWAFELPEKFGSDILDFVKFGFLKMLLEICSEKSILDISGTRNFGFRFPEIPDKKIYRLLLVLHQIAC
jgi:hypothetical protein